MAKQVWFKFYPADWLLDPNVRSLHPHQRDAYFTLLCYQAREGSIPDDEELCRRIVGYDASIWHGFASDLPESCQVLLDGASLGLGQPVWDTIKQFFSIRINNSEIANPKLYQIIKEYELKCSEISTKRSAAGKLGGLAKAKQMPGKSQANVKQKASKCRVYSDPDPDPDPDSDLKNKKKNKREAEASPLVPTGVVYSKITGKLEILPAYRTWLREQVELQGIELDQRDGPKGIRLTDEELQDGVTRLEDHLLANRQRTSAKTLPSRVRNWLCEDLRRKWERLKNRGGSSQKSPLQQTMETIARMNKEDRESGK